MKSTEPMDTSFADNIHHYMNSQSVQTYLHSLSGQEKRFSVVDADHNYAKPWNRHPDGQIRAKAAKFLFMKNFPKHFAKRYLYMNLMQPIDVETVDTVKLPPFVSANDLKPKSTIQMLTPEDLNSNELTTPTKTGWTPQMNKLWTQAVDILSSDRLTRLTYDSLPNEVILKKNLMERTTTKFRYLFAATGWDINQISWLNTTLNEYLGPVFLGPYHEAMNILRNKIPTLMDKFYVPSKYEALMRSTKSISGDPIQSMLNSYKSKRINGSPLFLIVPNGPQVAHQMTSQRMKYWHNLFGSLGKVITINAVLRPYEIVNDFMNEIRYSVREKIKECKSTFNEGRPLVLVGFGHSSLVAAHCALDNASNVNATICLGFPLTAINGFRGDLDDPLLETTVPTMFVIGQNSTMATLDDMEDFRERITKTETGLVVVGGANDRLSVSNNKKKFEGITQAMVDRCIADEIYDFVSSALNPSTQSYPQSRNSAKNTSNKTPLGVTAIPKPKPRRRPPNRDKDRDSRSRSRKKPKSSDITKVEKPNKETPIKVNASENKKPEPPVTASASAKPTPAIKVDTPVLKPSTSTAAPLPPHPTEPAIQMLSEKTTKPNPEQNITPESVPLTPIPTEGTLTPKTERHYGLSYGISEMPTVISQSATRTGRQIRAPKSLDV
ncbi:KAT8 regulatory NSL complex subunit 3-like [Oppia nitens]|uniref:KAT8 regulatory NSL complex subunit 3-like n=1 Tax=Oppia nitens TaxID=1686743 RepID=UPI0023DABD2D|nr:KAT8 regulatory NSL complex subunit 3-like [Oppia nitens]